MPYVSEWDVKALFSRSTVYIAPLPEGAHWRCWPGCEYDTLRTVAILTACRTHPIRPTYTPTWFLTLL